MKNKVSLLLLSVAVIIFVGGGLRAPITAVSPVLSEIIEVLQLNNLQGSLLTSIPLIVFATCSVLVSKLAVRVNIHCSLIYSLIFLIIGLYLRVYGNVPMLFVGSFFIGLGICIGNVTTPAYIKNLFPQKIGVMTGVFSVAMNLTAATASGLSIAIGTWTGMGWRGSLGIWIFWALLALLAVGLETFFGKKETSTNNSTTKTQQTSFNVFRSKQAWYISIFMGIQSLVYYCLVALLPIVLIDYGMAKEETGVVLLIIQLAMLPVLFISPVIATRLKDQQWMIYGVGVLMFIGIAMLVLLKAQFIYLASVIIGVSSGLAFSLSILFFSLKSKTMDGTLKISGKAQSVGYLIAAFGPPIFGMLHDWDSSWQSSFYFLLLMIVIMVVFGRKAAKPRFIEEH
ncbi:MAG: MFS transporter [Sphingobacterium sp.]|jgi:CP family cyanate transporter-like MFS transporter|nr:MFS transporter [Sphingobacterium sp.]